MTISGRVEANWVQLLDVGKDSVILFRVDASEKIGSGHVMRCLTLAGELQESCREIIFICRELLGNLIEGIGARGYKVFRLPPEFKIDQWQADGEATQRILLWNKKRPDWLVVDHYGLDKQWESSLRPFVKQIMVIDDLANREHDCDLLLDQNYYRNGETRYLGLVPRHSRQLLGPKYALLRQEFKKARQNLRARDGKVRRLLIFYGGSDPTGETVKALEAVRLFSHPEMALDVIVGAINPDKDRIKRICSDMPNTNFHCQVENMAELMLRADLALGAGGTTTWERCYLGLPSLVTLVAENQRATVKELAEAGAIRNLGWHDTVTPEKIANELEQIFDAPEILLGLSEKSSALF